MFTYIAPPGWLSASEMSPVAHASNGQEVMRVSSGGRVSACITNEC